MIKRLVKNIRQKPKSSRDNIALSIAVMVTVFVVAVWLYHAPARYSAIEEKHESVGEHEAKPGFSTFFDSIKDQVDDVKETVVETGSSSNDKTIDMGIRFGSTTQAQTFVKPSTTDKYSWPTEAKVESAPLISDDYEEELESVSDLKPKEVLIITTESPSSSEANVLDGQ